MTRTIRVGPPDPPSLNVYFPDAEDKSKENYLTATAGPSDNEVAIGLKIAGIDSYTNDLTVTITATMVDPSSANDPATFVGLSSTSGNTGGGTVATVTIPEGYSESDGFVYVYVKRANVDDTTASDKGIKLTATVDEAASNFFSGGIINSPFLAV